MEIKAKVQPKAKVQHLLSATGWSASCPRGTAAAYRGFVALVIFFHNGRRTELHSWQWSCADQKGSEIEEGFYYRYTEQRRKHAEVLGRFERDMEALSTVEIPPQARTPELARLSDLVPGQRMREWAAQCASSHQNLSEKVR